MKRISPFEKMLSSNKGSIAFSIILGLGIAALFRKACTDNNCIVITAPDPKELEDTYYKMNGECYKYKPVYTECTRGKT